MLLLTAVALSNKAKGQNMQWVVAVTLGLTTCFAGDLPPGSVVLLKPAKSPSGSETDLASYQGEWQLAWGKYDGRRVEVQKKLVIDHDHFYFTQGDKYAVTTSVGKVRLDADKFPKWIDVIGDDGTVSLGIYRLEDDMQYVCLAPAGKPRPTAFESEPGSGIYLEVFRKVGPAPRDLGAVQGTWAASAITIDGDNLSASNRELLSLHIDGHRFRIGGEDFQQQGTFLLNPFENPKAITFEVTDGFQAGEALQGIYTHSGDSLQICLAAPGAKRPKRFEAARGSYLQLQSWRRQLAGIALPAPQFQATKDLVALVDRAAALVASKGTAAFDEFRDPQGPWLQGNHYIFVNDMAGTVQCDPKMPELEGQDLEERRSPLQ